MIIGNQNIKESSSPFCYTLIEKAQHPARTDWQQFWTKKA